MNRRGWGLVVVSLAACLIAPWVGPAMPEEHAAFILTNLRIPRVLLAAILGGTLGLVGAAFQSIFENPLATPSTVGTTAGASLGALLILVAFPAWSQGLPGVMIGAFLGASLVSFGVVMLAAIRGMRIEDLLLAGIAITIGAGALGLGLQMSADAATNQAAIAWSLGSVSTVGYAKPLALLPVATLGVAVVWSQRRALEVLTSGSERAASQGVDLARTRMWVLGMGSLAVGACVAACGPIAFVGLIVPHMVRLQVGGNPHRLLPLSLVVGAGFLPAADAIARGLLPAQDLPVGVVTAALGAPVLLALLWHRQR